MADTLVEWTTARLTSLWGPASPEPTGEPQEHVDRATQLHTALDATFSPDAEFFLNHTRVERAAFADFLGKGRATTTTDQVDCKNEDCIETLVDEGNPDAGSIVAGTATIVHTHPWRIRAAPAKTRIVVVFSARINKSPQPQIVQLFHTWASKPFPIVMPHQHNIDASTL
ncbi:hypothetical protein C8F01DRAFT_1149526 [Mycena amicta]|nr:hypothetical protein C8F01DRAFT_1149526 [Mycena amicta]